MGPASVAELRAPTPDRSNRSRTAAYSRHSPAHADPEQLALEWLSDLPEGDTLQHRFTYHLQFLSADLGWLSHQKKLWRTQDGGKTWTLLCQVPADPEIRQPGEVPDITKIQFVNEQTGWLSMFTTNGSRAANGSWQSSPNPLLKTEDGGLTWQPGLNEFQYLTDFHFSPNGQHGVVASSNWDSHGG